MHRSVFVMLSNVRTESSDSRWKQVLQYRVMVLNNGIRTQKRHYKNSHFSRLLMRIVWILFFLHRICICWRLSIHFKGICLTLEIIFFVTHLLWTIVSCKSTFKERKEDNIINWKCFHYVNQMHKNYSQFSEIFYLKE